MTSIEKNTMLHQRRILGALCIALVPSVLLFGLFGLDTNPTNWYHSISSSFYSNANICMIGLIFATSVFFFSYRGYDWKDRFLSIVQAITVLGVIVFPNYNYTKPDTTGIFCLESHLSHKLHCITAGTFFIVIAFNLLLLFTKTGKEPTKKKKIRNTIYKVCGILILVAAISMFILHTSYVRQFLPENLPIGMICEFVMFTSFGFAYLVKSEAIKKFNDENPDVKVVTKTEYVEKIVEKEVEKIVEVPVPVEPPVVDDPKEEEPEVVDQPTEEVPEDIPESVIGFFQKIGINIDNALSKWFKKKK